MAVNETNDAVTGTGLASLHDLDSADTVTVEVWNEPIDNGVRVFLVATPPVGQSALDGQLFTMPGEGLQDAALLQYGLSKTELYSFFTIHPTGNPFGTDYVHDGTAGTLTWNFDSGSETFDFLQDGQTIVLYYWALKPSDNGNPNLNGAGAIFVRIDGTNDAPVVTSGTVSSTNEGVASGTLVYTASATDAEDDTVTYSLVAGGDVAAFSINSSTGEVTINSSPDYETKNSYNFTVKAADGHGDFTTQNVTLSVNDLPPVIFSGSTASVNENVAPNSTVYTASAADPAGGAVTYSLVAGGDAAEFSINSFTGVVTIDASPDYETKNSYNFTVKASDSSGAFNTRAVTLDINDVNEAPVLFIKPNVGSEAVAFYTFDEASGTIAHDLGGGHDGTIIGASHVAGLTGNALQFNGSQYVSVPDSPDWTFGTGDFSVVLWANFAAASTSPFGNPHGGVLIAQDEGGGSLNKWWIAASNRGLDFHVNGPSISVPEFFATTPFTPTPGEWYFIALTKTGSFYQFYVDDQLGGSATKTFAIPDANAPLTIGQGEGFFFNGRLDGVGIYHRALSQAELQQIYQDGAGLPGNVIAEGGSYQLTSDHLYFSDPDDGPADVTFTVSNQVNGTVLVNGSPASSFTGQQILDGLISFQHNGSETLTASFQVAVEDGNEDSSAPVVQAFNLTVTPVNDAPVVSIGAMTPPWTLENTAVTVTTASVADADAGTGSISIQLAASPGSLSLADTDGVTMVDSNGADGTLSFTGTESAINSVFANGMIFTPANGFNGEATLTIDANDGENSSSQQLIIPVAHEVTGTVAGETLTSTAGRDILTGQGGADTFDFAPNPGHDTITDFTPGADVLQFAASIFANEQAILTAILNETGPAVITVDASNDITLNVTKAQLSVADFRLV